MSEAYAALCGWENLFAAHAKAARGKRARRAVAAFDFALADHLLELKRELEAGRYRPGPYVHFHIHEPKRRKISAAPFRDRVVHHALCNVVEPRFERLFIHDSYANRAGKGTHRAVCPSATSPRRSGRTATCTVDGISRSIGADLEDEDHAMDEQREIIVGHSTRSRLLLVSFVQRGDVIRIISARKATRNERKDYAEEIEPYAPRPARGTAAGVSVRLCEGAPQQVRRSVRGPDHGRGPRSRRGRGVPIAGSGQPPASPRHRSVPRKISAPRKSEAAPPDGLTPISLHRPATTLSQRQWFSRESARQASPSSTRSPAATPLRRYR
jgi:hypothetical protein